MLTGDWDLGVASLARRLGGFDARGTRRRLSLNREIGLAHRRGF
jgi:hypothetical protein